MSQPMPPAGWYPAPHANNEQRYWDGTAWQDQPAPSVPDAVASADASPFTAPGEQPATVEVTPTVAQPTAGYTGQAQPYPTPSYAGQADAGQPYVGQGYPGAGDPTQAYATQAYPGAATPTQAYPTQAYPGQPAATAPGQPFVPQSHASQPYAAAPASAPGTKSKAPWIIGGVALGLLLLIGGGIAAIMGFIASVKPSVQAPPPAASDTSDGTDTSDDSATDTDTDTDTGTVTLTAEQEEAAESAWEYVEYTGISYEGLLAQLEWEGYSTEDSTIAIESLGDVDWNAEAVEAAELYVEYLEADEAKVREMLEIEQFTDEQIEHAVSEAL